MSKEFAKTVNFLRRTENLAGIDLLTDMLGSVEPLTRDSALEALLNHRSLEGKKIVIRAIPSMDEQELASLKEHVDKLGRAIQSILTEGDPQLLGIAIKSCVNFKLYGNMQGLAGLLAESEESVQKDACDALYQLAESLYCDLSSAKHANDLDSERRKATAALEIAAQRVKHHNDERMIDALLMIASPTNATLKRVLQDSRESLHEPVVKTLKTSEHGGVLRLLLAYLDDPHMPVAAKKALCGRTDVKFLTNVLKHINMKSQRVNEVLRGIDEMAWADPDLDMLLELDATCQQLAMDLLLRTGIPNENKLPIIIRYLNDGDRLARQYAAECLAEFPEQEATNAAVLGMSDEDPVVKGHLLKQLRPREVPGALSLLIRMSDAKEVPVKLALREALPEFSFEQFIAHFDNLSEERQMMAGCLVAQIDIDAAARLTEEMSSLSPVRRRKAVAAAGAMGMVNDVEDKIITLLNDDDHTVRIGAAKALAQSATTGSLDALRDATLDRSEMVRHAAEQSLEQMVTTLAAPAATDEQAEEPQAEEAVR